MNVRGENAKRARLNDRAMRNTSRNNPGRLREALTDLRSAELVRLAKHNSLVIGYTGGPKADHIDALAAYYDLCEGRETDEAIEAVVDSDIIAGMIEDGELDPVTLELI